VSKRENDSTMRVSGCHLRNHSSTTEKKWK
jgi:hypothetical protein